MALRDIPELGMFAGERLRCDLVPRDPKLRRLFAVTDGTSNWSGEVLLTTAECGNQDQDQSQEHSVSTYEHSQWRLMGTDGQPSNYTEACEEALREAARSAEPHVWCILPVNRAIVGHSTRTALVKSPPGTCSSDVAAACLEHKVWKFNWPGAVYPEGNPLRDRQLRLERVGGGARHPDGVKLTLSVYAWDDVPPAMEPRTPVKVELARFAKGIRRTWMLGGSKDPVFFYTNTVGPWGGVACIFQLVAALRDQGVNAHVVCITEHKHKLDMHVTPHFIPGPGYLAAFLAQWDRGTIVATHWGSARIINSAVEQLAEQGKDWKRVAFWQDREDLFEDKGGNPTVRAADGEAYCAITPRVMNAPWLKESGFDGLVIPVGLDPTFHRPVNTAPRNFTVVGMYRPSTPRRGPEDLLDVLRELKARYGDRITTVSYGEPAPRGSVDKDLGTLSSREVAELLDTAMFALDTSSYQGFGLPALEAMARGAVPLTFDNHGVHAYGEHNRNVVICEDTEDMAYQVMRLYEDQVTWREIQTAGHATARQYKWSKLAARWKDEVL